MGVVDQPVKDGVAKRGVPDHVVPVIDRQLAGHEGGTAAHAVFDELQEIAPPNSVKT